MGDFRKKVEKKAAENPANQYFTQEEEQVEEPRNRLQVETRPLYQRRPPEYKTRRLQLLLRPSLYDALKARADADYMSVNELINSILQEHMEGSEGK